MWSARSATAAASVAATLGKKLSVEAASGASSGAAHHCFKPVLLRRLSTGSGSGISDVSSESNREASVSQSGTSITRISAADLAPDAAALKRAAEEEEFWEPPELPGLRLRKGETILERYENTKDPELFERIFKLAFESLPPGAGPRKANHMRRQRRRQLLVDEIRGKRKVETAAAHERRWEELKARKQRDFALVAKAVADEAAFRASRSGAPPPAP